MTNRLALVVDDSKTARVTLKRMLEKQNVDADTVDSAQMAIDYLVEKTPDVIFMDHMMPGMDGLQAVEAIKSNPETATIPIMMYTSKEGDLYVSQARALGAIGILPKQVEPAELFEVLNKLGLIEDRRIPRMSDENRFVLLNDTPQEIPLSASREDIEEIARKAAAAASQPHVQQGHLASLLEDYHHEMVQDVRELRAELDQLSAVRGTPAKGSFNLVPPLVVGLLMLVPLLWSISSNDETRSALLAANRQLDQLQLAQLYQQEQASADTSASETLRAQLNRQKRRATEQAGLLYNSITWAINQSSPYDIQEEAYSDRRLTIIQELIARLQALGFRGTVQLHSHLGEFCLVGDEVSGYVLPPPDMPVTDCTLIGHPLQQLPTLGERQSIAFANFLATSPLVNNSGISIDLVPHLYSRPRVNYPPQHQDVTAFEWNRIASANNRVEVTLIPDAES
ncbi:MAG: response regulator [Gammaproteobacteria bacterium]